MTDLYMHTLDGKPAQWQPDTRTIVFAGNRVTRLAKSLKQIRTEQEISMLHYGDKNGEMYGYVRVSPDALNG